MLGRRLAVPLQTVKCPGLPRQQSRWDGVGGQHGIEMAMGMALHAHGRPPSRLVATGVFTNARLVCHLWRAKVGLPYPRVYSTCMAPTRAPVRRPRPSVCTPVSLQFRPPHVNPPHASSLLGKLVPIGVKRHHAPEEHQRERSITPPHSGGGNTEGVARSGDFGGVGRRTCSQSRRRARRGAASGR